MSVQVDGRAFLCRRRLGSLRGRGKADLTSAMLDPSLWENSGETLGLSVFSRSFLLSWLKVPKCDLSNFHQRTSFYNIIVQNINRQQWLGLWWNIHCGKGVWWDCFVPRTYLHRYIYISISFGHKNERN